MKNMIKNDEAVSVVVGAILILAILVTFMSVVTSSWVPIYERSAESDHGEELFGTFLDLSKQMENADEFPKISTVNLGTEEMPLMKNTNSVGRLELNESAGAMSLTSTIGNFSSSSNVGNTLNINNLDTSDPTPIQNFSFSFTTDQRFADTNNGDKVPDFKVVLKSLTHDDLEITFKDDSDNLEIEIQYKSGRNEERWKYDRINVPQSGVSIENSSDGNAIVKIDLLNNNIDLRLRDAPWQGIDINGETYWWEWPLNKLDLPTLIQHYLKQPADGTYDLVYDERKNIDGGSQTLIYITTENTLGGTRTEFSFTAIGGGILTMESDYNFMVDQSYIYDAGAVILMQEDGAVFKVEPPIFIANDSGSGDLILSFQTIVLTGNLAISGNGLETIQTKLANSELVASGFTDEITITKDTTSKILYNLWYSYFSELGEFVNTYTTANCTDISNESINQVGVIINSTSENILLAVNRKEIIVT